MTTLSRPGTTTFVTPSDTELVATRTFEAPRKRLWEALTQPEHMRQWMLGPEGWTMPVAELDLRKGGKWHIGWRGPDGTVMEMRGEFREVDPPSRLVQTESWGDDWPETLTTQVLYGENGTTTLTCAIRYLSKDARERARATGMEDGMTKSYDRLDGYLRIMPK